MRTVRKALVTGATGFIGSRLVEVLLQRGGVEVRPLVRNFGGSSRIARYDLRMWAGDYGDAEALKAALDGVDTVFHLAYGWADQPGNIAATGVLLGAARTAGVERFVHASTISVYEPLGDDPVDETRTPTPVGWPYTDTKIAIEELVMAANGPDLQTTAVLPTIVYGPFGAWTHEPLRALRIGPVFVPRYGEGVCNAVYVDDVVDALILAAERDEAVGERFLISGPDTVSWGDYYRAYAKMMGRENRVRCVDSRPVRAVGAVKDGWMDGLFAFRRTLKRAKKAAGPSGQSIQPLEDRWGQLKRQFKEAMPLIPFVPGEQMFLLMSAQAEVRIDKARELLGYDPRWSFAHGIETTEQYVRWARLI